MPQDPNQAVDPTSAAKVAELEAGKSKGSRAGIAGPRPLTPEEQDDKDAREQWAKEHGGRTPGIADQGKFSEWKKTRKKMTPPPAAPGTSLTDITKPKP